MRFATADAAKMNKQISVFSVLRIENGQPTSFEDTLAIEEPMEIRLVFGPAEDRKTRSLSVTMRTPGHDFELAVGFLVSEGIVVHPSDVIEVRFATPFLESTSRSNTVEVELHPNTKFEIAKLQRHFYTTSSCGVCGKSSLEALEVSAARVPVEPQRQVQVSYSVIHGLPATLRNEQAIFRQTGGLHSAGLFSLEGQLALIREDVGRHNAVDKVVGCQFLSGQFPLNESILVLSGRASFELLQKAQFAGIPIVVAVGAPSSLAVELARKFEITLIGFTSGTRFNIYSAGWRVEEGMRDEG